MQKTESGNHGTDDVRLTSISHHSLFYEPCFTYAGVDYFGPLNVKKGRSVAKRWEAKFTWMNSRAIQLELATSLESDCFINVFRSIGVRAGGARGAAAPPKFGQLRFFGQQEKTWAKPVFKDVSMFFIIIIF